MSEHDKFETGSKDSNQQAAELAFLIEGAITGSRSSGTELFIRGSSESAFDPEAKGFVEQHQDEISALQRQAVDAFRELKKMGKLDLLKPKTLHFIENLEAKVAPLTPEDEFKNIQFGFGRQKN